ncbi:MAG: acetamidase/formamidase [Moritella sp.]|jgi:acetamidase/formamidase
MKMANLGILTFFLVSVLTGCYSAESTVLQATLVRPVKLLTIGNGIEQKMRVFLAKIAANQVVHSLQNDERVDVQIQVPESLFT